MAGVDAAELDRVERRFWRECWETVPEDVRRRHGVVLERFGPVQATLARELPSPGMMNLVLGATEPGALEDGHLEAALGLATELSVSPYVPVSPGGPRSAAVEEWLRERGFSRGYGWMKFVRDPHPPRFRVAADVEVVELGPDDDDPIGMIAATAFELPAWAAAFFADKAGRPGWRCYVARVDGEPQACGMTLIDSGIAQLAIAATLEPARGRGCQPALLGRRIRDAAAAGCHTLFVETGERVPGRPSISYRNILRAGFREAYVRPNWVRDAGAAGE